MDTPDLLSRAHYGDRLVRLPPGFAVPAGVDGELPADPNHRLGRYFERLVEAGIRGRGPARFAAGVVIRSGGLTVGELDFVFQLPGEDFARHWEVSCKYYLAIEGRFVGLETRDRLDLKLAKLMDRQLRLPERPEARARLDELGYPARVVSQAWVKGMLFYREAVAAPVEVAPDHWRGRWATEVPADGARWVPLPKTSWIIPYRGRGPALSSAEARGLAAPAMLARVEREGDLWVERDRLCVVGPDWPGRAAEAPEVKTPAG